MTLQIGTIPLLITGSALSVHYQEGMRCKSIILNKATQLEYIEVSQREKSKD